MAKLSARFDSKLAMNLMLLMNFIFYVAVLPFESSSFGIGTEKIKYFSVFSLKHSNYPLNCFVNSPMMKW